MGHSEASKRPRFPGCPLRGFQPSGSYPQATDNSQFMWSYVLIGSLQALEPPKNQGHPKVPPGTKSILMKNHSETIIFHKWRISRVIPQKGRRFPEMLTVQNPSKIPKNNSQGLFSEFFCVRGSVKGRFREILRSNIGQKSINLSSRKAYS